ncbi:hypothetical protein E2C01_058361 [Portunus trituberculatus]|uniref:Uncharacterized protein n=1 Tax=Portunus trituberculatus TaxID=210409 RepID=A0A5B7H2S4_PORTR|nr:hypothetical protein [Portunus trituberculatus]
MLSAPSCPRSLLRVPTSG